ncbi:MAG: argininosuccinate lyase [candidate division NC10 bacterium]|nr:argininosuccinate lyase [candidate division NC10 bacterium]
MEKKPWSGRFEAPTDRRVEDFTASLAFDRRLARYDIEGSIAWARGLQKAGVLTPEETEKIVRGLEEVGREIEREGVPDDPSFEDIHMYVERRLIERIGTLGGKLHTGRSRNDQVALDLRLYLRAEIGALRRLLHGVQEALLTLAEAHPEAILPGYTHLQRAQPILFAHHCLAYVEMFERDAARLTDCLGRVDVLPLGSGALAGTTFAVDREYLAHLLNFPAVSRNSLDAVADRDFALEFLAAAAVTMVHVSRLAEEITLWASSEFGFVELPDAFATGSSMMPQKKNPDVAELARGKAGRVVGDLVALLVALKGLPLAYNRDMQEDKERVFDAADTLAATLAVLAPLLTGMQVRTDRMRAAAEEGLLDATDLADYLVAKGLPFRQAHEVVGQIAKRCLAEKKRIAELPLEALRAFSPYFGEDVHSFLRLEACVDRRLSPGGTARARVREALAEARARLRAARKGA